MLPAYRRLVPGAAPVVVMAATLGAQPARADSLAAAAGRALAGDLRLTAPTSGGARVCVTVSDSAGADAGPTLAGARAAFAATLRAALAGRGPFDTTRTVDVRLGGVVVRGDSGRAFVGYDASERRVGGEWGHEARAYTFRAAGPGWADPHRVSLYFADGRVTALGRGAPACLGG